MGKFGDGANFEESPGVGLGGFTVEKGRGKAEELCMLVEGAL